MYVILSQPKLLFHYIFIEGRQGTEDSVEVLTIFDNEIYFMVSFNFGKL